MLNNPTLDKLTQLRLLGMHHLAEDRLHEVVGDRRRDHEQEPRRGGERRGQASGRDQGDHPGGEPGDLGVGQDYDVLVDGELAVGALAVLDPAVPIAICEGDQARPLPAPEPLRDLGVGARLRRSKFSSL